ENAVSLTDSAAYGVARAAKYGAELAGVEKSLDEAALQLRDAAETLRDFLDGLDFSPEEHDRLETRLALLRGLTKKYGGDEKYLLEKLGDCRRRLAEIEDTGGRLKALEAARSAQRDAVLAETKILTAERKKAAAALETKIASELRALSMPAVSFSVDITRLEGAEGFDANGADAVRFLMSANKGERPGPISRIASGGELSRIMLAMKNVFSGRDAAETLVFDEIDMGVSGVAASRVGEKLAELSRGKQVLCVTHLPQIAAMADTHFVIEKAERDGRTYTSVRVLDREGRKRELARLHGGDHITPNTLLSAEEQLDAAERYKK
ncbi:MAG: DNA repair protein RecN, partial [Oscillospiraceae bacterium]|nr:DNA repair protein RecN [Oscillospiraceae bacterium]